MEQDSSLAKERNDSETESELDPLSFLEYVKLGVWDVYILRTRLSRYLPTLWKIEEFMHIKKDIPYLWMNLRDMSTVSYGLPLLLLYLVITLAESLIPALSLWYVALCLTRKWRVFTALKVFWAGSWNSEYLFSSEPSLPTGHSAYRHNLPSTIVPLMPISYSGFLEDAHSVRQLNMLWIMLRERCPKPSMHAPGSYTLGASSGPGLVSMFQHGMTLLFRHISTGSSRITVIQIQSRGRRS